MTEVTTPKSNTLCLTVKPGQTKDAVLAATAVDGIADNAMTAVRLSRGLMSVATGAVSRAEV
jgi:hypothetical protein